MFINVQLPSQFTNRSLPTTTKKKTGHKKGQHAMEKRERESFQSFINRKKKRNDWRVCYTFLKLCVCGGELVALLRGSSRLINLFTWKTRNMVDISSNVHTEKK